MLKDFNLFILKSYIISLKNLLKNPHTFTLMYFDKYMEGKEKQISSEGSFWTASTTVTTTPNSPQQPPTTTNNHQQPRSNPAITRTSPEQSYGS